MWKMFLPILVIVFSNTFYNVCAKSTPANLNTFASLTVTYGIAMLFSLVLFLVTGPSGVAGGGRNLLTELSKTNWTTWVLGLAVVGLEGGFLFAYRAGWKISSAQIVASISLTCVLLVVGFLFYHESITARQLIGTVVCFAGLLLITL